MYYFKAFVVIFLSLFLSEMSFAQKELFPNPGKLQQHPRILLLSGEEELIKKSIATNPIWKKMHETILLSCDKLLELPPIERIQIGRRLLDKSREALRRIFQLSYAWRMTGQEKYYLPLAGAAL